MQRRAMHYKGSDVRHLFTEKGFLPVGLLYVSFLIKCAQQPGDTKCGYYVMKYIHEIITRHADSTRPLFLEYKKRKKSYTINEFNVMRELWAQYFREQYMN